MLKNIPLYNPLPSGNFLPSRNGTLRFAGFHTLSTQTGCAPFVGLQLCFFRRLLCKPPPCKKYSRKWTSCFHSIRLSHILPLIQTAMTWPFSNSTHCWLSYAATICCWVSFWLISATACLMLCLHKTGRFTPARPIRLTKR